MKTESVESFLKRGGKVNKVATPPPEPQLTVDYSDKAQPSFFEAPVDDILLLETSAQDVIPCEYGDEM